MEIIRGNTCYFKFQRHYCGGEVITELPKKMYFTVKYDPNMDDYIFQKTLGNGITYNKADNYYYIKIEPEDTDNLPYTSEDVNYYTDVKVITDNYKKTIIREPLEILSEVTHAGNEGWKWKIANALKN